MNNNRELCMFKSQRVLGITLLFALLIIGLRSQLILSDDAAGGRSFQRGDGYSDLNTLSAVRHFYDHGLWASKLRPMHNYDPGEGRTEATPYLHYPALPDVLHGMFARWIGSTDQRNLRWFPLALSFCGAIALWFFLRQQMRYYWGSNSNSQVAGRPGLDFADRAAALSWVILVTSNYFLAWADGLHKHPYEEISKWLYFAGLLTHYQRLQSLAAGESSFRSLGRIAFLAALAFLTGHASFEPIVFLAVATVGLSMIFERSWRRVFAPINFVLGAAFVASFISHLYLNALYLGSWSLALTDLHEALSVRTGDVNLLKLPWVALERIERYFHITGFALLILGIFMFRDLRPETSTSPRLREFRQLTYVLLAASLSWYIVMKQHAAVHHFVGKQSGLLVGWIVGPALLFYALRLQRDWRQGKLGLRMFHVLFILYMTAMALTQQILVMWWEFGFRRLF